jgi:hypothetical protein
MFCTRSPQEVPSLPSGAAAATGRSFCIDGVDTSPHNGIAMCHYGDVQKHQNGGGIHERGYNNRYRLGKISFPASRSISIRRAGLSQEIIACSGFEVSGHLALMPCCDRGLCVVALLGA